MNTKKTVLVVWICLICFGLSGCFYKRFDDLTEIAREALPIPDAETVDLHYIGMGGTGDHAVVWFFSGNEGEPHYYLAIEVECHGLRKKNLYRILRVHDPILGGSEDLTVVNQDQGYLFIVHNPQCVSVKITDNGEVQEMAVERGVYPYIFFYPSDTAEYAFLDAEGNELPAAQDDQ